MTPAGRRDTPVEFQRAAPARSALGGRTAGPGDWTAIGSRLAKVLYGSGAERRDAAVEGGTQAATFRVLADSLTRTVTIGDRAACRGLTFDLTGIAPIGRTEIEFTGTASRGMTTKIKLSGFRELEERLLALSTQTARRHGRAALRDAAEPILDAYRAKTKVKSGTLLANESMGTRLNRNQRRQSRRPGPSEIELHVGTADPAGIQEEFGIRQAANPSLTPAWDSQGGTRALERIGRSLGESIERSARRGRPRGS